MKDKKNNDLPWEETLNAIKHLSTEDIRNLGLDNFGLEYSLLLKASLSASLSNANSLKEICNEQWSNAACCGYVIYACENLGYNKNQIKSLINSMQDAFERKDLEQAKRKYQKF